VKTRSRIRIVEALLLLACFAFFGCGSTEPITNNLTASGLVVASAEPRVGYPVEVTTFIEAEELTQDVSVSYYALNKSDVDQELDEVRQFFLATLTFPTIEPSVTEYLAEFTVPADVDPPGDYVIQYVIDPVETIAETIEDDNSASGDVRLAPLADPNIFIDELTLDATAIWLYDDFDDVETDRQDIKDVQNSDAGATLVVGLEGALEPVDVEATVDLRITRSDLPADQRTYDVPMYLWSSVAQRYVDAYGVNGPAEGLSIGTVLPQIVTETEDSVDFNDSDRTSVHLDVYFPGRLAAEMKKILEALPPCADCVGAQDILEPPPPPPDLTQEAINALKGFFAGATADQVSFSIVAKVRAGTSGFNEDVLVDNEASEEVFLILPGQRFFPPDEPLESEEGTQAGFDGKNFGVGFKFDSGASLDELGAKASVEGSVEVKIFPAFFPKFDFMRLESNAQLVPGESHADLVDPEAPAGETSSFSMYFWFFNEVVMLAQGELGEVRGIPVPPFDLPNEQTLGYTYPPADPECPSNDKDKDGFLNDLAGQERTLCQTDQAGPPPSRCNDKIDPDEDACPDEPGLPVSENNKNGCPGTDGIAPESDCPGTDPFSISKEVTYNQLFFVGPVPFTASATVGGEIGFDLYANIQPIGLAVKAGPFAKLEVTITGAVGIRVLRAGFGGTLTLIDEQFYGNVTAGLTFITDLTEGEDAVGFELSMRMSATNTLTGPQGELFLFADYPGVKWCSVLGKSLPCGVTSIRTKKELARFRTFVKEDILFDKTLCKARKFAKLLAEPPVPGRWEACQ
jgi:hypothetical protein